MNRTILLVEDDENDVYFLKHAFKEAEILNPLQVAQDGREAMDYLDGQGVYADRERFPLPCLMLLDLKLPRVMGFEVLKWIREQPELKTMIVIILTSSRLEPDIDQGYLMGVNAYLVKPSSTGELRDIATGIKKFWLEVNHGPSVPIHEAANLIGTVPEPGRTRHATRDPVGLPLAGSQDSGGTPAGNSFARRPETKKNQSP